MKTTTKKGQAIVSKALDVVGKAELSGVIDVWEHAGTIFVSSPSESFAVKVSEWRFGAWISLGVLIGLCHDNRNQ